MNCTIISVGTELSLGMVTDINSKFIADKLTNMGIECNFIHIARDNAQELSYVLELGLKQSDIIIINGGLGPTDDDLTRATVANTLGLKLTKDSSLDNTSTRFLKDVLNKTIERKLLQQSYIPEGSIPFRPRLGSASGFGVKYRDKWVFSIPGVPREMQDMLVGDIIPIINKLIGSRGQKNNFKRRVLMTTDVSESEIENRINNTAKEAKQRNIDIGITANPGLIKIILISRGGTDEDLSYFEKEIMTELEDKVYGVDEIRIGYHLNEAINKKDRKPTICVAESLTGGLISNMITDTPGSSDYFLGGIISYSNFSKTNILRVDKKILENKGAVSKEVCCQMSENVKKIFGADYSVAVTGYAGPHDDEKGKVFICINGPDKIKEVAEKKFLGVRENIKFRTAQFVLNRLRALIESD